MNTEIKLKEGLFAGGCFWCIEGAMHTIDGVLKAQSGYAGDFDGEPTCNDVALHRVHAREAVLVTYDENLVSYEKLVRFFFTLIDSTDSEGQFHDRGESYTTAIYIMDEHEKKAVESVIEDPTEMKIYEKPIATAVLKRNRFVPAETKHQNYKEKNPVHYDSYLEGSGRAKYQRDITKKHTLMKE